MIAVTALRATLRQEKTFRNPQNMKDRLLKTLFL